MENTVIEVVTKKAKTIKVPKAPKVPKPPKEPKVKKEKKIKVPKEIVPVELKKKKPKNYINNADMMIQIGLSRENNGKMTDELAKMLFVLVERYSKHPDYSRIFSYEQDMRQFALLTLVKVWKSFNPEKSNNPFAYFTQIIRHAFYQYLNAEKKQRTIKDEVLVNSGENPSYNYMEEYGDRKNEENGDYFYAKDEESDKISYYNSDSESGDNEASPVREIEVDFDVPVDVDIDYESIDYDAD